jgi:hypothetical protein
LEGKLCGDEEKKNKNPGSIMKKGFLTALPQTHDPLDRGRVVWSLFLP